MQLQRLSRYIGCFAFVALLLVQAEAKKKKKQERSKQVYCGACLALVDELNWNIASVDTKKKIQVGSFRVDSRGKQNLHEVPLARSEVQLMEFIDDVCLQMQHYAESTGSGGRISYIRTSSRDGTKVSLKNIKISDRKQQSLRYACETILEENEDDLIKLLRTTTNDQGDQVTHNFCVDTLDVCSAEDVVETRKDKVQSVEDGKKEKEEEDRVRAEEEAARAAAEEEEDEDDEDEEEEEAESGDEAPQEDAQDDSNETPEDEMKDEL